MTARRARFAIASGLLGLAALGVLGELAARVLSPPGRRPLLAHYNPAVLPVRWFSLPDGARSYFYEPGREALHCFDAGVGPARPWDVLGKAPDGTPLGCVSYRISPRGFRESGLEAAGEGRVPLLLVGDSFTFGEGVAVGQRVSEVLARQLDARARRSYSVRNRGVQGMSLETTAALYRGLLRAERPGLVVLGLVPNDAQPWGETVGQNPFLGASPERSLKREGFRLRSLELLRWRWSSAVEGRRTLGRLRGSFEGEGGRRFDEAFARLAADVRADGGRLLALLWPMTPALGTGDYPLGDLHRRIARQARALDVELLDLLPAVEGWPRERIWAHPTDPHPSPELHAAAAAALAARIEQLESR